MENNERRIEKGRDEEVTQWAKRLTRMREEGGGGLEGTEHNVKINKNSVAKVREKGNMG